MPVLCVVDDGCVLGGVVGGGVLVPVVGVGAVVDGVDVEITVGVMGDVQRTVSSDGPPVSVLEPVPAPLFVPLVPLATAST